MRTDVVQLGRLSGERTVEMMHFLSSMRADRCIADTDIMADIAHVLMLSKQRIIGPEVAKPLCAALLELFDDGIPEEMYDDMFEDVHVGIESLLVETVGADTGDHLHIGCSRNDEVAACIRIKLREEILKPLSPLLRVREVLLTLADRHTGPVMPGFTHLQHAQLTTLAHYLFAYEPAFSRDFDRLSEAYARINVSPLGAAAFASTGYPVSREYEAALLGFDGILKNTMDAVATRNFALETLADLSVMMATISRLCEELILWSTSFIRFVSLDDAFCSTSSVMPQKKNPDPAEIMRAKTGSVSDTGALMIVKGLPMSYNRDLQELTPLLWRGVRDAKESLRLLIDMLVSAEFDTERMREEAGKSFSTTRELADTLVRSYGLPFRTAHSIVGRSVQKGSLTLTSLDEASRELETGLSLAERGLSQEKIDEALDVDYGILLRQFAGGPAPFATTISICECKKQIAADSAQVEKWQTKLSKARNELLADARRLVA